VPDLVLCLLEMADGTTVRLSCNFYLNSKTRQGSGIEFHGDDGSLHLGSWLEFDSALEFAWYDKPYEPVPYVCPPEHGIPWARGLAEMAQAIREGRPHRATGEQAAHIVDVVSAAVESMRIGKPVDVCSGFAAPAPMEWAL
jgi:predicted dehydrogenase